MIPSNFLRVMLWQPHSLKADPKTGSSNRIPRPWEESPSFSDRLLYILRHSFASNLARHGSEQYKIDQLMGFNQSLSCVRQDL